MPKELTHWILADRALDGMDKTSALRALIIENHDCFLAGAVLPDTLLHHVRGPDAVTALALARDFHDSAGNSFAPLIRAEQRSPGGLTPAILACLLGVVTHMQADIVFHPFVYALTGTDGLGPHYRFETDMDLYFLQRGGIPAVHRLAELVTPATRPTLIDCCALLFDTEGRLPRQALEKALQHHCRFQGLYDRTFWKLAVRAAAFLAGHPYREQRHLFYPLSPSVDSRFRDDAVEWRHPVSAESRRDSLDQLAEETVGRIRATFEQIEAAGSLAEALVRHPGENLLTGMHGACLATMTV
jgi:hypothetical protein